MNARVALIVMGVGGALVAACQTYEFDPVKPASAKVQTHTSVAAQRLSPNVLFVVDRSGSMNDPASSGASGSKWQDLLSVMTGDGGFVSQLAQRAQASDPVRLGLLTFSAASDNQSQCAAPTSVQVPIAAGSVDQVNATLQATTPAGGTPTAASMEVAAAGFASVSESGRANYIVLLTDGAPNCNANWSGSPADCIDDFSGVNGCATMNCCYKADGTPESTSCTPLGCLDKDNLVSTIGNIATSGTKTFVIGFGADIGGATTRAFQTLDASAMAGGTARSGEPYFYAAANQADLAAALDAILAIIAASCDYTLDETPASPAAVEVQVTPSGGTTQTLSSSQYEVHDNHVVITDTQVCAEILAGTQQSPVTVTFAYLGQ